MSAVILLIVALCFFIIAYRFYASFIATKVLVLNDSITTPAITKNDGHDFVPTNKWVVFGHHFAAISGAGPLIGPVLAVQYGWGPGFLWLLFGSIFAGCVHDMIILFASIRHRAESLSFIARKNVGNVTGIATAIVILFIIFVSLAGLGVVVVNALFKNPWGVFSIGMTIPIAIIVGLYMYKIKPGAILSGSLIGVILVCLAVFYGYDFSVSEFASFLTLDKVTLSLLLPFYGFCAAALPVWLLLAPRDYLSTYMKIGVIAALAIGIFLVNPSMKMSFSTEYIFGNGPIINGPVWPYVFITIACGAISGFHSLISSGTTPKLIEKESQIPMIGYGAMLTESFVAIMALIAAATLEPADYYAINTLPEVFKNMNLSVVNLSELSQLVGIDVAGRPGGAISLAVGMANIFSSIGETLRHTMSYWFQFLIMFEALFILTTIDAGTRVARYILQSIIWDYFPSAKKVDSVPVVILTSAIVSCGWGYLLYTGDVSSIWPLFGTANQTLAALSLAIGTTILLRISSKKSFALITLIPLTFITITVIYAGFLNIKMYYAGDKILNVFLSVIIEFLIIIILADNIRLWFKLRKNHTPVGLNG